MWISNLKIAIASVLLLISMSCMHWGDDHHSGPHHSLTNQPPNQYLSQYLPPENVSGVGRIPFHQGSDNEK